MSNQLCCSCRSPKTTDKCELCHEPVCRSCLRFVDMDTFAYKDDLPAELKHSRYCDRCHATQVEPAIAAYQETLEKAKEVIFIPKSFRGQLFVIRKSTTQIHAKEMRDRDETIMKLAFKAAEGGFNALIQGDVTSQKVRNHGYQKSLWNGSAFPAQLDESKLNRNDYLEEVWRRGH